MIYKFYKITFLFVLVIIERIDYRRHRYACTLWAIFCFAKNRALRGSAVRFIAPQLPCSRSNPLSVIRLFYVHSFFFFHTIKMITIHSRNITAEATIITRVREEAFFTAGTASSTCMDSSVIFSSFFFRLFLPIVFHHSALFLQGSRHNTSL